MSRDDLKNLVDEEKAEKLVAVAKEIGDYFEFRALIDLGLTVHHSELDFDKILIFSWIKEEVNNGREHRVSAQGNRR